MGRIDQWYESDVPSRVEQIRRRERQRQLRSIILIPSESMCIPPVAELLASEFGHIYAEGYPQPILDAVPRDSAVDPARFRSWQRRLSDHRFYKGCVNVDMVELLAHRYVAQALASLEGSPPVDRIFVNVQALSGAAANNAVYEALLKPGDVLLGMKLSHGGHLTHGSPFNISGRRYKAVSYGVDPVTHRIDYDQVKALAREHRPRIIIGGASAYPWDIDWQALRRAADEVGALVLADIAHLAGMVVGGVLNNPLPYADVVTFTTHKTLCGPRGAVIVSKSPTIAKAIDAAVFPGTQGGPHMNTVAAIARLFELIVQNREPFRRFQQAVVDNTAVLARELRSRGFDLAYGGTNTHMLLADLKPFPAKGEPGVPIDGEIASRLLELTGIVVNKNTLPGDEVAGESSGIRMGMPWATQRSITPPQIARLADAIQLVLSHVHTARVWVPGSVQRCRGRIDPEVLRCARAMVDEVVDQLDGESAAPSTPVLSVETARHSCLLVRGDKVRAALQQTLTCNIADLKPTDPPMLGLMLEARALVIEKVAVFALPDEGREQRYALVVEACGAPRITSWLEGLSDGYLLFDPDDLQAKIDGPMVVEDVSGSDLALLLEDSAGRLLSSLPTCAGRFLPVGELKLSRSEGVIDPGKTFFIGQNELLRQAGAADELKWLLEPVAGPKRTYTYRPAELPIRRTVLNEFHRQQGAKMVPFAGWEMPVHYPPGIFAEHRAVRTAAGLFDVSHMGVFEIRGRHAGAFLETVLAGCVSRLDPGMAGYNYLLYPDGIAADDVYLYRVAPERYLLVVNAANAERDWDWLSAVNSRQIVIDGSLPGGELKQVDGSVELRNLREAGADGLIDLALQGPRSLEVLSKLTNPHDAEELGWLEMNHFTRVRLAGAEAIVARTGYTGELVAFELFVHPDRAIDVFGAILDAGRSIGVLPCGLGARDSTRTEAGLPLFGHELEGPHGGTLTEAGYGFIPRFHVPFFIGRSAYMRRITPLRRKMIRLSGGGRKSLRPGHFILDDQRRPAGVVTSFAYLNEKFDFVVLAYVDATFDITPGRRVLGARVAGASAGRIDEARLVELTAMPRFPTEDERRDWATRYA
jgi:glycine hydroxymethyltransferase